MRACSTNSPRLLNREGPWFVAHCAEVPGANGQGATRAECLANLREAIQFILEDRREEPLRSLRGGPSSSGDQ
ncbi:MAG: type II toxin-antitoxin system HicB family antitoxin [Acidobacteria bacterium]|nr:type II toxin-antitoxin system HicB family antitoxin [Acidobacteriota bacterium]